MSKNKKLLVVGITGVVVAAGTILYIAKVSKRRRIAIQRQEIADEGYETAFDILYPLKTKQYRTYKMKG